MEAPADTEITSPVFYQGRITQIIDPQNFWMQIGTDEALARFFQLETDIEDFCKVNTGWLMSVEELTEGQLVLVDSGQKENIWRRGQVARIDRHENVADVLYVDYGNTGIVPAGKICPQVPDHIMDQTQFALRCSLAGVQPIGRTWTSRGIRKFQELIEDQVFLTLVLYSQLGSVVVALYFDKTHNGRSVAHFLLDEEVAMPSEELEIPEFAKDVPSFLVAYAADYSSNSAGSFYSDETTFETQHGNSTISNNDMEKTTSSSSKMEESTVSSTSQSSDSVPIPKFKRIAPPPGFTETVNQTVQALESGLLQQDENEIGADDQTIKINDQFLNDISINSNVSFLAPVVEKLVDNDIDNSNIATCPVLHPLGQGNTRASPSGIDNHDNSGQIMGLDSPVVISDFNLQQIDHTHELSTHGLHHKTLQRKRLELEEEVLDIISEIDEHASIAALAGYGSLVDESKQSEFRDPLDPDVFQEISASIRDAVTRGDSRVTERVQDLPAQSPSRLKDQGSRRSPRQQRRKTRDSSAEEVKTQREDKKELDRSEKNDQTKESTDTPSVADIDFSKVVQEVLESGKTEGVENTKALLLEIFELISVQETKHDKHLGNIVDSLLVRVITEPDVYFTLVMEVLDKVHGDLDLKNFLANSVCKLQDRYIKVHVTGTSLHRSCARMIGGVFNLSVAWDDSNSTIQSVILTAVEKWIMFNMKGTQCDQDGKQAVFLDCFDDFWLVSGSILGFHNPEMVSRLQGEIKEKVLNEGVSRCIRERLLDMFLQNFCSLKRSPERCSLGIQTEGEITPDGGNKGRKSRASQTNRPECTENGTMTEEDWPLLSSFKTTETKLRQRTDKSKTTKDNLSGLRAAVAATSFNSDQSVGMLAALTGDQSVVDTIASAGQVSTFDSQVFITPIVKTKPPFYHHSPSPQTNGVPSSLSVEGSFFVTSNKSHGSLVPSCNIDEGNASKQSRRSLEKRHNGLPNSASWQSRQPKPSEIDKDLSKQPLKNEHFHDSSQISCEKNSVSEKIDWFDYDPSKHKYMQKSSAPKLEEMSMGDIAAKWISSYSKSDSLQVEKRENQTSSGASKVNEKWDSLISEKVSSSSMDSDRNKEILELSTSAGRNCSSTESHNISDKPCKSDGSFTEEYSKMVRDEGKKEIIDWWNMDEGYGDRNYNNRVIISNDKLEDHNKFKAAYHCENKLEDVDNAEEIVEPISDSVSDQVTCMVAEEEIEKLKEMYANDEEYNLKWQARSGKSFTKVNEFAFEEEEEEDEGDWEDLDDVESDYSSGSKPSSKGYIIDGVYHRAAMPKWVPGPRKCTTCGEASHLVYDCPNAKKSHLI
ncbi:hypothetical protein CHS0354_036412 [Potamilus streckersoni]|uniref:Tudor domain-containing protein n=1 Tax=Potamilus streckersoni TaxID=2493646 RepID=A0AAE0SWK1_9BIVA|nr:hypothetical protein CHS0354_036412 [Potamilus streckersoni]